MPHPVKTASLIIIPSILFCCAALLVCSVDTVSGFDYSILGLVLDLNELVLTIALVYRLQQHRLLKKEHVLGIKSLGQKKIMLACCANLLILS